LNRDGRISNMARVWKQIPGVIAFFLLGALFFEIYWNHEPVYALHRGGLGLIPIIYTPLALVCIALLQAWARPWSFWAFAVLMAVGVAVGIVGTALHQGIHARTLGSLLEVLTWRGEPPMLVPLSFSVGGLAGLVGAVAGKSDLRDLEARGAIPRGFYLVALSLSLVASGLAIAATVVAAAPTVMTYAFLAVLMAVAFDIVGAIWDWVAILAEEVLRPAVQRVGPD
jgi:hypothetical protein